MLKIGLQLAIVVAFFCGCATQAPAALQSIAAAPAASVPASLAKIHHFDETFKNSAAAEKASYVILVSLDGFRHDYAEKYKAKNLQDIAAHGVSAQSLIPVFPSKTFPNHYSIITGLYADEHGIVSNEFYDPVTKENYSAFKGGAREAKWYGGEPLWITAEKNGFVSASYFWVASEAPIEGKYPNLWVEFNEQVPDLDRVHQVIDWLKLPAADRPHFITLYFSGVDHAGHKFGTDSHETAQAVQHLDSVIGELRRELSGVNLPVNLIVVSDHGMDTLSKEKIIGLDSINLEPFIVSGSGTMMKLYLKPGQPANLIERTVTKINALHEHARAWKSTDMKSLHFSKSPRSGDIVVEADAPYSVQLKKATQLLSMGDHGWNPARFPSVRGIFYAEGPDFQKGMKIPAFENVHIFPMVANILGFTELPKVSGRLSVLKPALTKRGLASGN